MLMAVFTQGPIRNRNELPKLLSSLGVNTPKHTAVEIGVGWGCYAAKFLKQWNGHYYLVDPWDRRSGYGDYQGVELERYHSTVQSKFGDHPRVTILRLNSLEALDVVPNDLASVYLDPDHTYPAVIADLEGWWLKICPGGVLAGHDLFSQLHPDVTEALVVFARQHNLKVFTVGAPARLECNEWAKPSWFIVKEPK